MIQFIPKKGDFWNKKVGNKGLGQSLGESSVLIFSHLRYDKKYLELTICTDLAIISCIPFDIIG